MNCDKCGSASITYYKQRRKDGVWVVTARCENDHHPKTGKPFYPIAQFDIASLPVLPGTQVEQPLLIFEEKPIEPEQPKTLIDLIEIKRKGSALFPPLRKG